MEHRDCAGTEIKVGDVVATCVPKYTRLVLMTVTKLHSKKVGLELVDPNSCPSWSGIVRHRYPNEVAVVKRAGE